MLYAVDMDIGAGQWEPAPLLSMVSAEKQEEIKRYARKADAERKLVADLLTRYAVSMETGVPMDRIRFGGIRRENPMC